MIKTVRDAADGRRPRPRRDRVLRRGAVLHRRLRPRRCSTMRDQCRWFGGMVGSPRRGHRGQVRRGRHGPREALTDYITRVATGSDYDAHRTGPSNNARRLRARRDRRPLLHASARHRRAHRQARGAARRCGVDAVRGLPAAPTSRGGDAAGLRRAHVIPALREARDRPRARPAPERGNLGAPRRSRQIRARRPRLRAPQARSQLGGDAGSSTSLLVTRRGLSDGYGAVARGAGVIGAVDQVLPLHDTTARCRAPGTWSGRLVRAGHARPGRRPRPAGDHGG